MIESVDVIVDLQYGDTGKGKITNMAMQTGDYNICLRYNGGSNAGHTFYYKGTKVVTHQVPVGALYGIPSIVGPGCVVNIDKLSEELKYLSDLGIVIPIQNLMVDKRAHVVQGKHIKEDADDVSIGTTKQGIGPAYRDKYGRTGMIVDSFNWIDEYPPFTIIDIYEFLYSSEFNYNILCEGAQGFYLDVMWGEYPYVTSSHCTVAAAIQNGVPYSSIRNVFGIAKVYETYVGNKTNFIPECQRPYKALFDIIGDVGKEYGATTGRRRQVRFLNLDELLPAINMNGVTHLFFNKLDILEDVELLPVAQQLGTVFQYQYNGKMHSFQSSIQFRDAIFYILKNNCPTLRGDGHGQTIKFSYGAK